MSTDEARNLPPDDKAAMFDRLLAAVVLEPRKKRDEMITQNTRITIGTAVWCANLLGVNGTRNDTAKNGWAIYLSYGTTGNNIAFQHTNTGGSVAEYLDISGATGAVNNLVGDFIASAVGKTLTVKGGANALSGTFVLSSGTASIATTAVDANTVIACTVKTASGTLGTGTPEIVITSGSGFTATGIATDNSTYNWIGLKANQ